MCHFSPRRESVFIVFFSLSLLFFLAAPKDSTISLSLPLPPSLTATFPPLFFLFCRSIDMNHDLLLFPLFFSPEVPQRLPFLFLHSVQAHAAIPPLAEHGRLSLLFFSFLGLSQGGKEVARPFLLRTRPVPMLPSLSFFCGSGPGGVGVVEISPFLYNFCSFANSPPPFFSY